MRYLDRGGHIAVLDNRGRVLYTLPQRDWRRDSTRLNSYTVLAQKESKEVHA